MSFNRGTLKNEFENEDYDLEKEEVTPFILKEQPQSQQGWLGRMGGWVRWAAGVVYSYVIKPAAQETREAAKNPVKVSLALMSSIPPAFYAMLSPGHKSAAEISKRAKEIGGSKAWAEWWYHMSPFNRSRSVLNAISSLDINYKLARDYTPKAIKNLVNDMKEFSKSPIGKATQILFGFTAAVAMGFMAYETCGWLAPFVGNIIEEIIGATVGLINLGIFFFTRYVGVKNTITWINNHFNEDRKFQKELIDDLKRVKKEHKKDFDHTINERLLLEGQNGLNQDTVYAILDDLIQLMNDHPEYIRTKNCLDHAGLVLDATFALTVAIFVFPTFNQKFIDAIITVEDLISGTQKFNQLSDFAKIATGTIPALISSMLFFISGLYLRETIVDNLPQHPAGMTKLLIENGLACGSMQSVAQGIVSNPHNIFSSILSKGQVSSTFIALNAIGALTVNGRSSIRQVYGSPNGKNTTLDDLIKWLSANELTKQNTQSLRLFHRPPANQNRRTLFREESSIPLLNPVNASPE